MTTSEILRNGYENEKKYFSRPEMNCKELQKLNELYNLQIRMERIGAQQAEVLTIDAITFNELHKLVNENIRRINYRIKKLMKPTRQEE